MEFAQGWNILWNILHNTCSECIEFLSSFWANLLNNYREFKDSSEAKLGIKVSVQICTLNPTAKSPCKRKMAARIMPATWKQQNCDNDILKGGNNKTKQNSDHENCSLLLYR